MTTVLIALCALGSPPQEIDLNRMFKAGDKATYEFSSRVQVESRQVPLETFIPQTETYTYTINSAVEKMKPDGIADVRMKRPNISVRVGETFEKPPETIVLIKDVNHLITLSRKNQVLDFEDFTPKQKPPGDGGGGMETLLYAGSAGTPQLDIMGWMSQLRQLGAFVNFFDNGPILPNGPIAQGGTWKETVGYSPVTVKEGADRGKNINARLDYEMTYMGVATRSGKQYRHIQGKLQQDTDAAPHLAEMLGVKLEQSPVNEVRLKMEGTVDYYLDLATLEPVEIIGVAQGSVDLSIRDYPAGPFYQERFKSRATLVRK